MDAQKEALCRIIDTLANKKAEVRHFLDCLDVTATGLQEESSHVLSELEVELQLLRSALDDKGAELRDIIIKEKQRKEAELQRQQLEGNLAMTSCDQLLELANQTLSITTEEEFLKAARQMKDRKN